MRRILAALLLVLAATPAGAALRLCNRTSYVLYAATATLDTRGAAVTGWTRVVPGACTLAIAGDLAAPSYYVYARASRAHSGPAQAWGGTVSFCTKDTDFTLHLPAGLSECPDAGMTPLPFAALDTHHMRNWTMTFRQTPDLKSMQAAQAAGIARLLRDTGAKIPAGKAEAPAVAEALARFKARLNLARNVSAADLFDALETEAMKTAAPAGYAVCNDTGAPVFAALGQETNGVAVSQGWWKVAAGACARAIALPLKGREIDLLVEAPGGRKLVSGPAKYCVTNIEFAVQGRGNCAKRGLAEAGFARTNLGRADGFAAHISGAGLVAPSSAAISK